MFNHLLFKTENNVAYITLNRPETMNAFNHQMMQEFIEVMNICKEDKSIRAIVITGAGKMFSAGGDIKWMKSAQDENWKDNFGKLIYLLHKAIRSIRNIEKPVIAAVNGFASGAGFSLALACDIRIASENAKFNQAYINIGLTPDGGSTYFLTQMLGMARALDLIFTARVIDAKDALDLGLVSRVVPSDSFEDEIKKIASTYATGPTLAFGRAKILVNKAINNDFDTQLTLEAENILLTSLSNDFKEGLNAFFDKRKPNFFGE